MSTIAGRSPRCPGIPAVRSSCFTSGGFAVSPQRVCARPLSSRCRRWHRPAARRTVPLAAAQRAIALATGGAAGARLAMNLHMPTSAATLIRLIRSTPLPPSPLPTSIGVDDWAMRKRHRYGALICDLETHRSLHLLPDRSADTLATWLQAHPQMRYGKDSQRTGRCLKSRPNQSLHWLNSLQKRRSVAGLLRECAGVRASER